jgi:DeoR/GlpR family transcriptional regulator of sugar metabolism
MGIGGVTEAGFSNNNTLAVGAQQKMIAVAARVIIVADHTKFGRAAMIPVAPLTAANVVVSDRDLAPEFVSLLRDKRVEVLLA